MAQVEPNSGDMLPMRRAIGERQSCHARSEELHEFADHAFLAQQFGDGQHQIGRGGAFGQSPVSCTPITCGISMVEGWPSMAASASMPPTPQPSTPSPLTMVVCESVPTKVSG